MGRLVIVNEQDEKVFEDKSNKLLEKGYDLISSSCGFVDSPSYDFCNVYQAMFIITFEVKEITKSPYEQLAEDGFKEYVRIKTEGENQDHWINIMCESLTEEEIHDHAANYAAAIDQDIEDEITSENTTTSKVLTLKGEGDE